VRQSVLAVVGLGAITATALACSRGNPEPAAPASDTALRTRIESIAERFLFSDAETDEDSALAEARDILAHRGVPSVAVVGDQASYAFVFVNLMGQPPELRNQLVARVREAKPGDLPDDARVLVEARLRVVDTENKYQSASPRDPALRDRIVSLYKDDQGVREQNGFTLEAMEATDRRLAGPLKEILDRHGVPRYETVGVEAAKGFVVMVQHQSAAFRASVLPQLKANVAAGQADPGSYALVYDRTQRDQQRNQLYGEQLECGPDKTLVRAPLDDAANVNRRRAELGLMRIEFYERLVRQHTPDVCQARPQSAKAP